jgi:hypothetical protein
MLATTEEIKVATQTCILDGASKVHAKYLTCDVTFLRQFCNHISFPSPKPEDAEFHVSLALDDSSTELQLRGCNT